MSVKKYKRGKQISSIDEMMKKEFIYVVHDNKEQIYNAGWFKSWQLMYANNLIVGGCVYEAIPNFEIYISIGGGALKSGKDECAYLKNRKVLKDYLEKNLSIDNLHIEGIFKDAICITDSDRGIDSKIFNDFHVLNMKDFILKMSNSLFIDADGKGRDMMFILNKGYDTFESKNPKFIEKV